ncbi:hypothetical protein BG011_000694 [Mortierella polycephala]|uniref:AAA+ ATPase domain-containing protein n=1 Tax=Mortierella polycephala TaxID=41804 RepID=A0A9P6PLZ5_9FUNG|nr:hypothetical protein BG011_000694 [Mortierella polycephala]
MLDLRLIGRDSDLIRSDAGQLHNECLWIHPMTLQELRIPSLGLVAVQHPCLFHGAKTFQRCMPYENVPQGMVSLPSWILSELDAVKVQCVQVEGVHRDQHLGVVKKIVIAPLATDNQIKDPSHWIKPTIATNASLVRGGRRNRAWTENLIKLAIEGQVLSAGAVFLAKVTAHSHLFKVMDIQFEEQSLSSNLGVIMESTIVDICQEPIRPQIGSAVDHAKDGEDGEVGLSKEICRFIVDSFCREDAYARLNIPNKKAVIVTGVAGAGKNTIVRDRNKLPDVFTKPGVFQHEFNIPIPIRAQRQSILESLRIKSDVASMAAQVSSGYVAKDLRNLCRSASLYSLREGSMSKPLSESTIKKTTLDSLTWENFSYAIDTSKPSQQIEFESIVSRRTWNDFGGYATLKKRVHQSIHWPITNPETFKRMGVKPPMGLLLYGPSGCGKTMLIQVLAYESKMNFIPIKGPEIFSKYLGETEATLRRLFAMARQIAPCILFFDEMDSIGAKRGWGGDADSGSNGINERVLSTLLNEMDGVEERTGVFVVGCTNQPRAMDDALLRPGRLDQLIYVGYPTLQDRKEIIETISKRIPLPTDPAIQTSLAQRTVGFSPGDMDSLFREAAILSLRRNIESDSVHLEDIDTVLQRMSPTVQDRIDKSASHGEDDEDVLVPELYRQFQQDR